MTKTKLLLVSLLFVFGLGVMAPNIMATTPLPTYFTLTPTVYSVRGNGGAEAMGPLTLTATSGYGTIAGTEVLTLGFSQPIVGYSSISAAPVSDFCTDTIAGAYCSAQKIKATGPSTVTVSNGPSPVALGIGNSITLYGFRVDIASSGLPIGGYVTQSIAAQVNNTYPMYFLPPFQGTIAPTNQTVTGMNIGYNAGPAVTVTGPVNCATGLPTTAESLLTCKSAQKHHEGRYDSFSIIVTENFSGAWTSLSDEYTRAPFAPNGGLTVTNGSDISITVTGIPDGITITPYAPSAPSGCTSCSEVWGPFTPSSYTGTTWNDTVTFDFPIAYELGSETESAEFTFSITGTGGTIGTDNPPLAISVTLDPNQSTTSNPGPNNDYPWFYYAAGTEESPGTIDVFYFIDCVTNLLFPYVTNYNAGPGGGALGNWDTFMNIADATSDPWWPHYQSAIPQDGNCTFYLYDAGQGVGAADTASPVEQLPNIFTEPAGGYQKSGGEFGFALSQTPAHGTAGAYVIVTCQFLNATGYAQIVDNANGLGNYQVMSSYLAFVFPNVDRDPRSTAGYGWGEFAIVPPLRERHHHLGP